MSKLFASLELNSISISFVGFLGELTVWCITDLSTGTIEYVVDDSGGSD